MKSKLFLVLLLVIISMSATTLVSNADSNTINVVINGTNVNYNEKSGVPYIDSNGRTLVPLRATMEAYGCDVNWDAINKMAIVEKAGTTVKVPIGQPYILINGTKYANDTVAQIKDNRTYLPIRAVLEAFLAKVEWDDSTNTVIVGNQKNNEKEAMKSYTNIKWYKISSKLYSLPQFFDGIREAYCIDNNYSEVYVPFEPSLYIQGNTDLRVEGELVSLLALINGGYTISVDNPYIDGTLDITDLRPYRTINMSIKQNVTFLSATQKSSTYTYTYNNQSLTTPDIDSTTIEQNGVRFLKYKNVWLVNVDDFLKYFGFNKDVYMEYNDIVSDYCFGIV